MSIVTPYIEHLKYIMYNLDTIAGDIVLRNADFIIDILVTNQLHEGRDSAGRVVGHYSKRTEEIASDPYQYRGDREGDRSRRYSQPNQPKDAGSRYNFDWSSDFIEGIYLIQGQGGFDIWSADAKVELIENKYGGGRKGGAKLLKLTKEHNDFINEEMILPGLRQYFLHNMFRVGQQPEITEYMHERSSYLDSM